MWHLKVPNDEQIELNFHITKTNDQLNFQNGKTFAYVNILVGFKARLFEIIWKQGPGH